MSGVIFIIATQLDQTAAHSKLLKRMCMLYCGQQTRGLFISNDYRPASLFTDILLAMGMAVITMVTYGENNPELKTLLDGLLFLYGDILDFAFQYGTFKVTLCAFGASMFLKYIEPPARCSFSSVSDAHAFSDSFFLTCKRTFHTSRHNNCSRYSRGLRQCFSAY